MYFLKQLCVEIKNNNGRTLGSVEFTFNNVEDTRKLVG